MKQGKRGRMGQFIELGVVRKNNSNNDKQVIYLKADIDSLKRDTGFELEVRFEEGAARLIEFFKNQGYGRRK